MKLRIDYQKTAPNGISALPALENYVRRGGLEPELLELVKLRASQINGCAYCIDMHTKDARAEGESEQRLVDLTLAIIAINGWNRLAISFRSVPGTYQRAAHRRTGTIASRESESKHGRDVTRSQ